jgi:poly(3-hydroxybutyrate) depolymerase
MKIFIFFSLFLSSGLLAQIPYTVSGISSGGYMAQQFHTAFSREVSGAAMLAGGPYWCAKGQLLDALNKCMNVFMGAPSPQESVNAAKKLAQEGKIDQVENLKDSRVYVLSGTKDEIFLQKVSDVMVESYKLFGVSPEKIRYENKIPVGHAFPTDDFGNNCGVAAELPFISNCNKDVAGEILNHLYGNLAPRKEAKPSRMFAFDQLTYLEGIDAEKLSMHQTGYVYVPEGCEHPQTNMCRIHIAFHGCKQTLDDIQTTFITKTGYNTWAQANRIVILYPQAKKMKMTNPQGCWDWWGYTGSDYHTKNGSQLKVVKRIVEALRTGMLKLKIA